MLLFLLLLLLMMFFFFQQFDFKFKRSSYPVFASGATIKIARGVRITQNDDSRTFRRIENIYYSLQHWTPQKQRTRICVPKLPCYFIFIPFHLIIILILTKGRRLRRGPTFGYCIFLESQKWCGAYFCQQHHCEWFSAQEWAGVGCRRVRWFTEGNWQCKLYNFGWGRSVRRNWRAGGLNT